MAITKVSYKLGTLPLIFTHWSKLKWELSSRERKVKILFFTLFHLGGKFWFEFWVEFSKITKNGLKVGKNSLKVGFDLVWWVPYSALLFVGGHDTNYREV